MAYALNFFLCPMTFGEKCKSNGLNDMAYMTIAILGAKFGIKGGVDVFWHLQIAIGVFEIS